MENFNKELDTPEKLFACNPIFYLQHNDIFSIENMTDRELRQSIVADVLVVTMWEKEFNYKAHFGFTKLMRNLERWQYQKIHRALKHNEISGLFVFPSNGFYPEIRIKDHHKILQAAMDYCGGWYHGFEINTSRPVIMTVDVRDRIEKHGGIENMIESLMIDFQSTGPSISQSLM